MEYTEKLAMHAGATKIDAQLMHDRNMQRWWCGRLDGHLVKMDVGRCKTEAEAVGQARRFRDACREEAGLRGISYNTAG
jgi:hypothetical protein